ncbi:MAG TPA: LamG domain-containing protein, partial [Polyangiaceae bacterium]|nr:LamG domain-containing protein [Polyangiaceae bacterium]
AVALCQCSLLFDVGPLDRGDPWPEGGSGALGGDGEGSEDAGAPADAGDAADGSSADAAMRDVLAGGDAPRSDSAGRDAGGADAVSGDGPAATDAPAATDGPPADGPGTGEAATDASSVDVGLWAYYPFDETSGTSAADATGQQAPATLIGGASFASGLSGDAATMNGSGQYVSMPTGIVAGLSAFSISAWVKLNTSPTWSRIFDFGTGTTAYMFLTPNSGAGTLRYAITVGGYTGEQRVEAAALPTGSWQHVAVTMQGTTCTLYVNGAQVAQNAGVTLDPASLGTTGANWLGRSQFFRNPDLDGQIDGFRIYDRALDADEVTALFQLQR